MKWLLPLVVVGGLAAGGFFLFMTPQGKRLLMGVDAGIMGYDDPYKYYDEDPDAFDPTSKRYKDIVKGTMDRAEKARRDKKKKIQKEYIEAYLADAF